VFLLSAGADNSSGHESRFHRRFGRGLSQQQQSQKVPFQLDIPIIIDQKTYLSGLVFILSDAANLFVLRFFLCLFAGVSGVLPKVCTASV